MQGTGGQVAGSEAIFTPAQVRARDEAAIAAGVPGYLLMERAATAALAWLRRTWPCVRRPLVVCGAGNNGGDGLVLARLAAAAGLGPTVVLLVAPERLCGDAAQAWRELQGHAVPCLPSWPDDPGQYDLIVDALLGTGLTRPVEGTFAEAVDAMNAAAAPVLALDVPSGLCAATGQVLGRAVTADLTVTFVGRKIGHYLGRAPDLTGHLCFEDLGVEAFPAPGGECVAWRLPTDLAPRLLPPRSRLAHKGASGHVLVIGGAPGTSGAARLAAEAALHAGAGWVTVATAPEHAAWLNAGRPEIMCTGVRDAEELAPLLERADVLAVGPGLGQTPWSRALLGAALRSGKEQVLDADALNLLAASPHDGAARRALAAAAAHTVLTPHPGEAARLLALTPAEVQADRPASVQRLVQAWGCVTVLKGTHSLIAAPGRPTHLCDRGNPALAVAGTGDVLTGVIAALLAQGAGQGDVLAAAAGGVMVHALAGDAAARAHGGERGLLAGELGPFVRRVVNGHLPPPVTRLER